MVNWQELATGQIWCITPDTYVVDVTQNPTRYIAKVFILLIEAMENYPDDRTVTVGWPWNLEGDQLVLQIWKSFPYKEDLDRLVGYASPSEMADALERSPSPTSRSWAGNIRELGS